MSKEIVINKCYGGFGLSRGALLELRKMKNKYALEETDIGEYWDTKSKNKRSPIYDTFLSEIPRDDKDLIEVVKKLGDKVNGSFSKLSIVEIPDHVDWQIGEYDGMEHVEEKHNTWY
jgi:hypothetical protein